MKGHLHSAGLPGSRERPSGSENDTDLGLSDLLGEEMRLVGAGEGHLEGNLAVILNLLLELNERGHDVRVLHVND